MSYKLRNTVVLLGVLSISLFFATVAFANASPVNSDLFQVTSSVTKKGKQKIVRIEVRPEKTIHCNLEYPWKLVLKSSESFGVVSGTFRKADAAKWSDELVAFEIPLSPSKGTAKAIFELKLSVCNDKQCFMKKVPVVVSLK